MRNERGLTAVIGGVLAFVVGFCAAACAVTAFQLAVSLWAVALWCLLTAAVCAVLFRTRIGWAVPVLFGVAVIWLLLTGTLADSAESLCYSLSRVWRGIHGWKLIRWSTRNADEMAATLPPMVYLLSAVTTAVTAWSVCRRKSGWVAVAAMTPWLLLCLTVPEQMPGFLWVIGLFFAVAMILLTAAARKRDHKQGTRAVLYTALPLVLAVAILFITVSPVAYDADRYADSFLQSRAFRTFWATLTGERLFDGMDPQSVNVDLTKVGPQRQSEAPVLYVTTEYEGPLYIRGSGLDTYDGLHWTDGGQGAALKWPDKDNLQSIGEVILSTRYAHRMLYLPYYATSMNLNGVTRGVVNDTELTYYSVACALPDEAVLRQLYPSAGENRHTAAAELMEQCTQLPDATRRWASKLVKEIVPAGTVSYYHVAQSIGAYVRASAVYDLTTPVMPAARQDFAQWFLEESDSGYCIHFASAAVVLLKAAGIPARYVSGYLVTTEGEGLNPVLQKNAHAWAEYWLPGYGWTVLEATPSAQETPEETEPAVQPEAPEKTDRSVPGWVWIVLAAVAALSLLGGVLQWPVRVMLRRRRLYTGDVNQQILGRWQIIELYCRHLRLAPDRELFFLAQKAKFSPHALTEAELERFDCRIAALQRRLKKRSLFRRFYDRLILALY